MAHCWELPESKPQGPFPVPSSPWPSSEVYSTVDPAVSQMVYRALNAHPFLPDFLEVRGKMLPLISNKSPVREPRSHGQFSGHGPGCGLDVTHNKQGPLSPTQVTSTGMRLGVTEHHASCNSQKSVIPVFMFKLEKTEAQRSQISKGPSLWSRNSISEWWRPWVPGFKICLYHLPGQVTGFFIL